MKITAVVRKIVLCTTFNLALALIRPIGLSLRLMLKSCQRVQGQDQGHSLGPEAEALEDCITVCYQACLFTIWKFIFITIKPCLFVSSYWKTITVIIVEGLWDHTFKFTRWQHLMFAVPHVFVCCKLPLLVKPEGTVFSCLFFVCYFHQGSYVVVFGLSVYVSVCKYN